MKVPGKARCLAVGVLGALCAVAFLGLAASASAAVPTYSNGFESNTEGWFGLEGSTIARQESGYVNPGGYASGISSASGSWHARLERGACDDEEQPPGGGPPVAVNCPGPFTRWGGYNSTWTGGWTTQVDVYLDVAYAQAHRETAATSQSGPSKECLEATDPSTDPTCSGTRFDYTSAVNNTEGEFIRDFGFSVSTGLPASDGGTCAGFTVNTGMNVNRLGSNPTLPGPNASGQSPQCIEESGWYTFKHTFEENTTTKKLEVVMEIIPVGGKTATATWTVESPDPISSGVPSKDVGCNRYGWFSDQEIYGLAIDNASMTGCGTPPVPVGKIAPTGTTCQEYSEGTASVLGQLQYTLKGGLINAVSPGVFFYYTKVSGTTGQEVDITQNHTGTAPAIPIQHGQVVLYNASTCKALKWTVTDLNGTATGTLPSSGDFIIGVKYSPSGLKGQTAPSPSTVTYSFGTELNGAPIPPDEATIVLEKK